MRTQQQEEVRWLFSSHILNSFRVVMGRRLFISMAFIGRSSADVLRADDTSPEAAFPAQTWILSGDSFAKGAFLRNRFSFRLLFPPFFLFLLRREPAGFLLVKTKTAIIDDL